MQDVAAGIAEGEPGWNSKGVGIKPAFRRGVVQSGITNQIGAIIEGAGVAVVSAYQRGERSAGLERSNTGDFPSPISFPKILGG